jgi:tetratricopeptide (TPR) repeat protein
MAIVEASPDTELADTACRQLTQLAIKTDIETRANLREVFEEIINKHLGTLASDTAKIHQALLYEMDGLNETAESTLSKLVAERPQTKIVTEARIELAEVRYVLGVRAFANHDYENTVLWLERLLPEIALVQRASNSYLPKDAQITERRAYAIYAYGEACQRTGRWEQATEAFNRLAAPGSFIEEVALYELVRCYSAAKDTAHTREAYERLSERFPTSIYIREAQGLL